MAKIEIKLQPFLTPSFARFDAEQVWREEGFTDDKNIVSLEKLDPVVLSELCNEFRAEVFRKAGKVDPHVSR